MDVAARMELIRDLCSFEGRVAGTDAERRAANRLAERLRSAGRRAEIEPTYVHPQVWSAMALHCLLGVAGSLVAVAVPALGFGLVLLAATSLYLDLNYRFYILRRLFFRRVSQNVVSPSPGPGAPARLVLVAHYDAGRTGAVFVSKRARRASRFADRHAWAGPYRLVFWSLALLLPTLGARMAELDSSALAIAQLPFTLVLLVAIFLFVDVQLSDPVPAAGDNAAGVATAVSLAEELGTTVSANLDVWVVLAGAGECLQEGMRSFVRAHRKELGDLPTYFLALGPMGGDNVRFRVSGGWAISYGMDRRLVELAAAIADADAETERRFQARPLARADAGEEMPPRLAGFPAIAVSTTDADGHVPNHHLPADTPDNLDPESLERAHAFALELIARLNADLERRGAAT